MQCLDDNGGASIDSKTGRVFSGSIFLTNPMFPQTCSNNLHPLSTARISLPQANKPNVTSLMKKASPEQKELATDIYHLLTTYDEEE